MTMDETAPRDGFILVLELIDGIFGVRGNLISIVGAEDEAAGDLVVQVTGAHRINITKASAATDMWRQELSTALENDPVAPCFINALGMPLHLVSTAFQNGRISDCSAVILQAISASTREQSLSFLLPVGFLSSSKDSSFRSWLGNNHRVDWVIFLDNKKGAFPRIHRAFAFCIISIRVGEPSAPEARVARFLDLRDVDVQRWPEAVRAAHKRGGGELGPSIVLRNPTLDERPWTFERFSKRREERLSDASSLGQLKLLGSLIAVTQRGVRAARPPRWVRPHEALLGGAEHVPCLTGRSIDIDGRINDWRLRVPLAGLDSGQMLAAGDVLIRTIGRRRTDKKPLIGAIVTADILPATFDHSLFRLRWRPEIPKLVQELLTSYLGSEHIRISLVAEGVGLSLTQAVLTDLQVPYPSDEVLLALSNLLSIERRYTELAAEAASAARKIFAASNYASTIPELIRCERDEMERLRAAEDALRLDYRVRNYYPHPVALRRELLAQEAHGLGRFQLILECAEHAMTVLGLMCMAQLAEKHHSMFGVPSNSLRAAINGGSLHMDWGKYEAVLREALAYTDKHSDILTLPFPALGELSRDLKDPSSRWGRAEGQLRRWRHDRAHLHRRPDDELQAMSAQAMDHLDEVLERCSFFTRTPLVFVEDYALEQFTKERRATFRVLQGGSLAFRRFTRTVPTELSRGDVGFLDHKGIFVSLTPWAFFGMCGVCKRNEFFVVSRVERSLPTFIAMETGHPFQRDDLSLTFKTLLADPTART